MTHKIQHAVLFLFILLALSLAPFTYADGGASDSGVSGGLSAFEFMKPLTNNDLVISPSGRYVAFANVKTKKLCFDSSGEVSDKSKCRSSRNLYSSEYTVIITNLEDTKDVRILPLPANNNVNWLRFVNDDRLLVGVGARRALGLGQRKLVNIANAVFSIPVKKLEGAKDHGFKELKFGAVVDLLRDDPNNILVAGYKRRELDLWKVDVVTGKEIPVAFGTRSTTYWYTDKKGVPKLRYDCGRTCETLLVYAENEDGKWRRIRKIRLDPDEDIQDASFYPAAYSNNDDQILILSDEDEDERRAVKVYDFNTNSTVETVYEHPKYDVQSVLVDNRTEEYLGVTYIDDRRRFDFVDDELDAHFEIIDRHFNGETNITFIGQNSNGNRAIIYSSSYKSPGGYYIYDFKSKKVQKLISTEMELESALNSDGKIMQIPMRDGVSISAYHYFPKGRAKGAPLLVMPHGGPHVRDHFGFDYWAQYFVSRGYQVVTMNFRGSSGYGKKFEEAGYGEWGGIMQDDITDTVQYFYDQKIASPDKTCIVGYSYGGYAALYGGATTPELYKCIVSGAGVSDLVLSMKDDKKTLSDESYEFMIESMGNPKTGKDKLSEKSPLNLVENFQDPVLLLHGKDDMRVKYHHSTKMFKALKNAGKDVTMISMPDVGHNGWDLQTDIKYLEDIEAFVSQHLGN